MKRRTWMLIGAAIAAAAVAIGGSLLALGCGSDEPMPPATPRPTVGPPATPFFPPTQTPLPTPAPIDRVPAPEGGRPDCPRDWNVYHDPDGHFSVCYPADWSGISAPPQADLGTALSLEVGTTTDTAESRYVHVTMYWSPRDSYEEGIRRERCSPVSHWDDVQKVGLTLAGRSVTACVGYETLKPPEAPPLRGTFAEISLGPDKGYVVLFVTQPEGLAGAAAQDLSATLASLRLAE